MEVRMTEDDFGDGFLFTEEVVLRRSLTIVI